MASRPFQIIATAAVGAFVLCPLRTMLHYSNGVFQLGEAEWAAFWFTLKQAISSAFISVFLARLLSRALARSVFWGRSFVILILGALFILPVVVAILGLIAVLGQNEVFNFLWTAMGFERVSIYGLQGVLSTCFFQLATCHKNASFGLGLSPQGTNALGAKSWVKWQSAVLER